MDTEKINVFIPAEIADILKKDASTFELFKKDNSTVNMNRFLSQLICGYFNAYMEAYTKMTDQIKVILQRNGLDSSSRQSSAADLVFKKVLYPEPQKKKGQQSTRISLKPTESTKPILDSIERSLNGDSMSQFLCRMFTSYTQKPLNERERIIFKKNYDFLITACSLHRPCTFMTIWNVGQIQEVLPYCIAVGQEELYNYLLCQCYNPETNKYEARTYRLNRIMDPQFSFNLIMLDDTVRCHLDMMKKYGPQFPINDDEESCVRLTKDGVRLFTRIYFGRPIVDRIEERDGAYYYYFKGSKFQLYTYFRRFDEDHAVILYPASLRDQMINAHKTALNAYTISSNDN